MDRWPRTVSGRFGNVGAGDAIRFVSYDGQRASTRQPTRVTHVLFLLLAFPPNRRLPVLGAVIVLLSCLANHLLFPGYKRLFLMSPFILIILIVYIDVWIIRRNLAQREARSPVFGPHRMSIAPDGLVDETSTSRHFYKWLGVEHIEIDSRFIYVIIDSPFLYLISKRSFKSEEEADAFSEALLGYYQAARAQNP
jgi:hypothetical protein